MRFRRPRPRLAFKFSVGTPLPAVVSAPAPGTPFPVAAGAGTPTPLVADWAPHTVPGPAMGFAEYIGLARPKRSVQSMTGSSAPAASDPEGNGPAACTDIPHQIAAGSGHHRTPAA